MRQQDSNNDLMVDKQGSSFVGEAGEHHLWHTVESMRLKCASHFKTPIATMQITVAVCSLDIFLQAPHTTVVLSMQSSHLDGPPLLNHSILIEAAAQEHRLHPGPQVHHPHAAITALQSRPLVPLLCPVRMELSPRHEPPAAAAANSGPGACCCHLKAHPGWVRGRPHSPYQYSGQTDIACSGSTWRSECCQFSPVFKRS